MGIWALRYGQTSIAFRTVEWLRLNERTGRPVEGIPSGLHARAVLATISAPIRSDPSFHYYMYQLARRLSRVKLVVICGARSAL